MKKQIAMLLALVLTVTMATPVFAAGNEKATTMRVEKTEGTVKLTNQKGVALPVRNDSKLYSGYALSTKLASYAYIGLDDQKAVKLDEVSEVTVKKSGKKLELQVGKGQLFFHVKEPLKGDETMEIRTANMVTGIRGTSGVVKSVTAASTEFYLLDGTATMSYTDTATGKPKEVAVKAGEMAVMTSTVTKEGVTTATVAKKELTPANIAGFAAVEISKDPALQKKIEQQTALNVKQILDTAQDKLKKEQAQAKKAKEAADRKLANKEASKVNGWNGSSSDSGSNPARGHLVTFEVDGGTAVPSQWVAAGGKATKPKDPTKAGFLFYGWYTTDDRTVPFDFETAITGATTVYAKWIFFGITLSGSDLTMENFTKALAENTYITLDIAEGSTFTLDPIGPQELEIPQGTILTLPGDGIFATDAASTGALINNGAIVIGGEGYLRNAGQFVNSGSMTKEERKRETASFIRNEGIFTMSKGVIDSGDCIAIENYKELVINGGKITSAHSVGIPKTIESISSSEGQPVLATLTMTGGTVANTGIGDRSYGATAIYAVADTGAPSIVDIQGGTVSSVKSAMGNGIQAYHSESAVAVSGGRITGSAIGVMAEGSCTITGGTIERTSTDPSFSYGYALTGVEQLVDFSNDNDAVVRAKLFDRVCNLTNALIMSTPDEQGWFSLLEIVI